MENGYTLSLFKWTFLGLLSLQLVACEDILNQDESERISQLNLIESTETIIQGVCSQRFVVQRQVQDGSPALSGSTMVTLRDTGSAMIYSDSGCTQIIRDPLEISEGHHSLVFYIKSEDLINFKVSAMSSGLDQAEIQIQTVSVASKVDLMVNSEREIFFEILNDYLLNSDHPNSFKLDGYSYEVSFLAASSYGAKDFIQLKRIEDNVSQAFLMINEFKIEY